MNQLSDIMACPVCLFPSVDESHWEEHGQRVEGDIWEMTPKLKGVRSNLGRSGKEDLGTVVNLLTSILS